MISIKNIEEFLEIFNKIKNKGWIESVKNGLNAIGMTFEKLIGTNENNFEIPDFNGIEVKTKKINSKAWTTLFNAKPDGPHFHENERLKDRYGYPHSKYKCYRVLNNSISSNEKTRINFNTYFQLKIDRKLEKLTLLIYDRKGNIIEDEVFWDFDTLKEKLYRKLKILAFVEAYTKTINGKNYFKYYKATIFLLKDFETFISLLEKGYIRVTFKINVFLKGPRKGQIHDHGTGFDIQGQNFLKLFNKYN